jgi:cytosine deaminase
VVVGDDRSFHGGQDRLAEHGVEVTVVNDPELIETMGAFIAANPGLWNEDIGEA